MAGDFDFINVGCNHSAIVTDDSTTRTWTTNIGITNYDWWHQAQAQKWEPFVPVTRSIEDTIKIKLPEGVELMTLYDVYMIYAESHNKLITHIKNGVLAQDEEAAKIKSGLMRDINPDWDTDYLTFVVKCIGEVKTKAKPKEVKTV